MAQKMIDFQKKLEDLIANPGNYSPNETIEIHTGIEEFLNSQNKDQELALLKEKVKQLTSHLQEVKNVMGLTTHDQFLANLKGMDGRDGKSIDHEKVVTDVLARMPKSEKLDINSIISAVLRRMPRPSKEITKPSIPDELNKQITSLANEVAILKSKSFAIIPPKKFGGGGNEKGGGTTWQTLFDLTGAVNGSNVTYTVPATYPNILENSEEIFLNGALFLRGSGNDYTISLTPNNGSGVKATITMASAPAANRQSPRMKYITTV